MGATLRYTVLRLGIFVLCLVVASALGAKGWLALLIAAVVSVLLSLVLLRRQREEMATRLQGRIDSRLQQRARGTGADEAAEDRDR